jgi:hypothetical protein
MMMRQCFCSLQGLKTRLFFSLCCSVALSYNRKFNLLLNFQPITIQGHYDRFLAGKTASVVGHISIVLLLSCSMFYFKKSIQENSLTCLASCGGPEMQWGIQHCWRICRILKFYPNIVQQCVRRKLDVLSLSKCKSPFGNSLDRLIG